MWEAVRSDLSHLEIHEEVTEGKSCLSVPICCAYFVSYWLGTGALNNEIT